jgi:hypothetical protein
MKMLEIVNRLDLSKVAEEGGSTTGSQTAAVDRTNGEEELGR